MKRDLAWVISRVFDPIIVIPVLLSIATYVTLVNGERIRFFIFLFLVDVVLPGIVLGYFIQEGRVLSGWDVKKREERVPLFFFVTVAHLVGVLAAWFLNKHPLAEYLTGFWILTVIYAIVTVFWKISVHVGVMSAFVTFCVLVYGNHWAWMYTLVLIVMWGRVHGHYHRLSQVVAGGVVSMVILPIYFWVCGLW